MKSGQRISFYVWVLVVLAVAVVAVVLGWHASGGPADPSDPSEHLSRTTAVVDSAVLVFREGLETILVLAAVTASFLGGNRVYRKPVADRRRRSRCSRRSPRGSSPSGSSGCSATVALDVQAATGMPAIIVLLVVMNWFFHKVYWTGWISHHHRRRRNLLAEGDEIGMRRMLFGLGLLGFTSVYREGFEIVVFLQNLRVTAGTSVVLEGVVARARSSPPPSARSRSCCTSGCRTSGC